MKKMITILVTFAGVLFIAGLILNPVITQSSPKGVAGGKPIPESVMKIADRSCIHCHVSNGNPMAAAHLNLSNWDKESPEKQAEKANAMCKMVTKGKMPPKSFAKSHPDGVPSAEEVKIICDWAQSIQVEKK
jgi:hypothetical protein